MSSDAASFCLTTIALLATISHGSHGYLAVSRKNSFQSLIPVFSAVQLTHHPMDESHSVMLNSPLRNKNMFYRLSAIFCFFSTVLTSTPALAHNGFHNDIYHPLSGPDHFAVVIIIALLLLAGTYYFYRK